MTNTTANTNAVPAVKVKCEVCGREGGNGARYEVKANGKTFRVHKPCGDQLIATMPQGVEAKLVPSAELRAEWKTKKAEQDARKFWAEKCPGLVSLREKLEASESTGPAAV